MRPTLAMQAIIFDLEGTLLDVRDALYYQYETLTEEFDGAKAPREAIAAAAHGTPDQMLRSLVGNTDVPFEAVRRRQQELGREAYQRHVRLYHGVEELLPILTRLGIKCAVLTHNDQLGLDTLKAAGIYHHFAYVATAEDLPKRKPHAESVHYVLQKLAVEPSQVAIVGDGVVDVLAGKNAGLAKTIGISHGFGSIEALRAAGADHIVHDVPSLLDIIG
jgi:HAD superfamily hydrolase (TIGR01509 family)